MTSKNTRVATYLPEQLSKHLEDFKSERELKSDSKALILILNEFFNVTHLSESKNESIVAQILERLSLAESKIESIDTLKSELLDSLKSELYNRIGENLADIKNELLSESRSSLKNLKSELENELLYELKSGLKSESKIDLPKQLDVGVEVEIKPKRTSKPKIVKEPARKREHGDGINSLTTTQLAARLKDTKVGDITTKKSKTKTDPQRFVEWSKDRDPDGFSWEYRSDSTLFYQVAH